MQLSLSKGYTPSFTDCAKSRPLCASFTDVFLDAIAKAKKLICESIAQNLMPVSLTKSFAKAKKLICESIAQNLMPVSLTKSFLALAMAFNLLLSNPT